MAPITGQYTQVSSEKYEDFLKALGVGFILRKAALASTPVMTITEEGGNWTMVTKTTVKSIELKFRLVDKTGLDKNETSDFSDWGKSLRKTRRMGVTARQS